MMRARWLTGRVVATRLSAVVPVALVLVVAGLLPPASAVPAPADSAGGALVPRASVPTRTLPPVNATADYQLGGAYPPARGVTLVTRDLTDAPASGVYSICYVNAFQTQPELRTWWLTKHPTLLLRTAKGRIVTDPGWPGEMLLDTSTSATRASLAAIMGVWFTRCAKAGYRAVEPDNLDSWSRSTGRLTLRQNAAYAALLSARAHALGLAIAQKNDTDMLALRSTTRFDFAVTEECQVYAECTAYTRVYGRHVIEIEYTDKGGRANFRKACAARGSSISIVYRDRDLVPRGSAGYVYSTC
jgi:hypothetical protein